MNTDDSIGYVICTVARKIHQHLTEKFKAYGITPEQWVVLKTVSKNDGISQKELADKVEKDPNNIKVLVDKLETKLLVKRTVNTKDKRAFSLCITPTGNALVNELTPIDEMMLSTIEQDLNGEEMKTLKSLLSKIEQTMDTAKQ